MACVKIAGRANFACSVDFKRLMYHLQEDGYGEIALELSDCLLMDSTFLGVLASIGLKATTRPDGASSVTIDLLNPNQRVTDLVDNLGISSLFRILHRSDSPLRSFDSVRSGADVSKQELTQTCLEAHLTLMNVNPNNVPKFKDVAQYFAEELLKHPEQPI